jgi:hypothetical protein
VIGDGVFGIHADGSGLSQVCRSGACASPKGVSHGAGPVIDAWIAGVQGSIIRNPCAPCGGRGVTKKRKALKVDIPAGVDDRTEIRISNQGNSGTRGAPAGHLFVQIRVKPSTEFRRESADVHSDVPISVAQAILGGSIPAKGLKGPVNVPVSLVGTGRESCVTQLSCADSSGQPAG